MGPVAFTLWFLLGIFLGLMLVRLVVDWVQVFARSWTPRGPVLFVLEIVYTITDPPIVFVRRFVPPLRLGARHPRHQLPDRAGRGVPAADLLQHPI